MRIINNINKVIHDDNECLMNDCLRTNELLVIEYLIANCKDTNDTIPKPAHTPFNDIIRTKMLPVYLFYNIPPSQYPTCPYVGNQCSYVSNANMKGAFSGALSISMIIQWEHKWIKNKDELRTQQKHNNDIIHPQNPPFIYNYIHPIIGSDIRPWTYTHTDRQKIYSPTLPVHLVLSQPSPNLICD